MEDDCRLDQKGESERENEIEACEENWNGMWYANMQLTLWGNKMNFVELKK